MHELNEAYQQSVQGPQNQDWADEFHRMANNIQQSVPQEDSLESAYNEAQSGFIFIFILIYSLIFIYLSNKIIFIKFYYIPF